MSKRYLIVGRGLSGLILGRLLREQGNRVILVGCGGFGGASLASQGLMSSISGLRFAKTWLFDECFAEARRFYTRLEKEFSESFFSELKTRRFFVSAEARSRFLEKYEQGAYGDLVESLDPPLEDHPGVRDDFGSFVYSGGRLNVQIFLRELEAQFQREGALLDERFEYQELEAQDDETFSWRGQWFDGVIFCEGAAVKKNPWFDWLPVSPIKGQILTIEGAPPVAEALRGGSLLKSCWLVPEQKVQGRFRLGATYERDFSHFDPDSQGTSELLRKLDGFHHSSHQYKVLDRVSGVRPCSGDHRPIVGRHPLYEQLYCFNGFGSKGSLWIPYWARRFVETLGEGECVLPPEVDVRRFLSRYE